MSIRSCSILQYCLLGNYYMDLQNVRLSSISILLGKCRQSLKVVRVKNKDKYQTVPPNRELIPSYVPVGL